MRFVHDGARVLRLLAHGVHGRFEDDAFPLDHLGSCASARSVCVRPLNAWRYVDIDGWFQAPPLEAFGHAFYKLIEERTVGRARADHIHLNDPAGEVFGATREANSEVNIARREPLLRINLDVERSCSLVRSLNPSNHLGSP